VFGLDLSTAGVIPFPNLEYRLTGATYAADGLIWVINKYAPREADVTPLIDPLAERHGRGPTHSRFKHVERLVPLINRGTHLVLADRSPIQLVLDQEPRDWEGVAMLDQRGFLLVTDEHPTTLLGFVPMPPRQ